jgi:hypothetical protein
MPMHGCVDGIVVRQRRIRHGDPYAADAWTMGNAGVSTRRGKWRVRSRSCVDIT